METKSSLTSILILLLQGIINGSTLVIAQKPFPIQQACTCRNNGNFRSDSLLKDRDDAFDTLYSRIPELYNGFDICSNTDRGNGVWTMSLCPPNIKMEACRECVNNTIPYLKGKCRKQKEGVAWTALPKLTCIVRYADYSFAGKLAEWAWTSFSTPPNQTPANASDLEKGLDSLANKLKETTAAGNSIKKFASGAIPYGPGSRALYPLYGYMQCTPDIGKNDCMKCLSDATNAIHNCCGRGRKLSGIALSTNCYFWYAHANFSPKTLPTTYAARLRRLQLNT